MVWLLLLPLLIFVPFLGAVMMTPGGQYSDLLISHYPNALWIQRSILEYHQIPLWSPSILSGYPFAADPLSGLWYPPGWLGILLPFPAGFNLAILLHLFLGGAGLYAFLRNEEIASLPALLGAVLFEIFPKTIAHVAAGHVSLVYAVSWTPWLLLAADRQHEQHGWKQWILGPGIVMGVIALADVRWILLAGVLWLAYYLSRAVRGNAGKGWRSLIGNTAGYLAAQVGIGLTVAAPMLLPLLEYTRLSTRARLTPGETFQLSLPPERLLGLFFPSFGGSAEWVVYPGAVAMVCVLFAIMAPAMRRKSGFWIWVAVICLVFALGEAIPFLQLVGELPGFNLLRVPTRVVFIGGMAAAILTARGADALFLSESGIEKMNSRFAPSAGLAGLGAFALLMPAGIWLVLKQMPFNILWGGFVLFCACAWVVFRLKGRVPGRVWIAGMLVLALSDLAMVNLNSIAPRTADTLSRNGEAAAAYLARQPEVFRVYSPSYSIPQQIAAKYHLELADGVDPLQLSAYQAYMEGATGVPSSGYSVTLPPYANGDPAKDNQVYLPDPERLGLLNVRYIASDFALECEDLVLRQQFGDTRIYENQRAYPRAWVQAETGVQTAEAATVTSWTPDQVRVSADGPGMLVLSEIEYPGWEAEINGRKVDIQPVHGILRGVSIGAGRQEVTFSFSPASIYAGLGIGGMAWIFVGLAWLSNRRRPR